MFLAVIRSERMQIYCLEYASLALSRRLRILTLRFCLDQVTHTAMADIRESLAELKFYRRHIFKQPGVTFKEYLRGQGRGADMPALWRDRNFAVHSQCSQWPKQLESNWKLIPNRVAKRII